MTLDGRTFRSVSNTENGTVDARVLFQYSHSEDVVHATYQGGDVRSGHLIGIVTDDVIDARYHHITTSGEIMTGTCKTRIDELPDGRIRLNETWQWTCGDHSSGVSVVEEIVDGSI